MPKVLLTIIAIALLAFAVKNAIPKPISQWWGPMAARFEAIATGKPLKS